MDGWMSWQTGLHLVHCLTQLFELMCGGQSLESDVRQFHVLLMQLLFQLENHLALSRLHLWHLLHCPSAATYEHKTASDTRTDTVADRVAKTDAETETAAKVDTKAKSIRRKKDKTKLKILTKSDEQNTGDLEQSGQTVCTLDHIKRQKIGGPVTHFKH